MRVAPENARPPRRLASRCRRPCSQAAELVRRPVTVIIASGGFASAFAAKAATTTIPIVFLASEDPVRLGLVASLARPGENVTGIDFLGGELVAKRLEFLRELVPAAALIGVLVNPTNATTTETTLKDVRAAADGMGLRIQVFNASNGHEIEATFAGFLRERPDALFLPPDVFFFSRRVQLANLASRHAMPTAFPQREYADAGALMSYGSSLTDAFRQVGVYAGRILKGMKPADLPVAQSTKLELVINAQTARMLGLAIPTSLLATADEVIE
jgi:putative tryptophan/tyrosine transport system substrate-binding protein